MSIYACPIETVNAPLDQIWAFLSQPANYAHWWRANTVSITPEGHAAPGQVVEATVSRMGLRRPVRVTVRAVDDAHHTLDLTTTVSLGITVHSHLTCAPLESGGVRVAFG